MSEAKQFACLASADIGLAALMFHQGHPFIGATPLRLVCCAVASLRSK